MILAYQWVTFKAKVRENQNAAEQINACFCPSVTPNQNEWNTNASYWPKYLYVETTRKDLLILINSPHLNNFYFFNSNIYKHQEDFAVCLMAHNIKIKKKKKSMHVTHNSGAPFTFKAVWKKHKKHSLHHQRPFGLWEGSKTFPCKFVHTIFTECLLCTDHHLSTGDEKEMEHGVYLHQTLGVVLPAPASTLDQGEWASTHLPFLYEPGPKNGFGFLNQLKRNQEKNVIT